MTTMAGEVKSRIHQLTQQRDLLSTIVNSLVEGVIVVDRQGAIVLVNDTAKQLMTNDELPAPLAALVSPALTGTPRDQELELAGRTVRASARPLSDHGAIAVLYD